MKTKKSLKERQIAVLTSDVQKWNRYMKYCRNKQYDFKANLRWADLSEANLRWADLSEADLRWADLSKADLRWADLRWADLSKANLSEANLSVAH